MGICLQAWRFPLYLLCGFHPLVPISLRSGVSVFISPTCSSLDTGLLLGHSLHKGLCLQNESVLVACLFPQSSSGDLMIRNIQLKHGGKYVCVVQSAVDSVSSAADLVVRGKRRCHRVSY